MSIVGMLASMPNKTSFFECYDDNIMLRSRFRSSLLALEIYMVLVSFFLLLLTQDLSHSIYLSNLSLSLVVILIIVANGIQAMKQKKVQLLQQK